MQVDVLEKGSQLSSGDRVQIFATNDDSLAIMEWEEESAAQLAYLLHQTLRGHALCDNCVDRRGQCAFVVRRLAPLPISLATRTSTTETELRIFADGGREIDQAEVTQVAEIKPAWWDVIQDATLHATRTLRAHICTGALQEIKLTLTFGIAPHGECQLQMINPHLCEFGSKPFSELITCLQKH